MKNTMDEVKVIEIKKSIFEDNDRDAEALRGELKSRGVYLLNLMSAPGSGKTTTLIQTINRLKDKLRIAVMEADIDSDVDAIKIKEGTGVSSAAHRRDVPSGCRDDKARTGRVVRRTKGQCTMYKGHAGSGYP